MLQLKSWIGILGVVAVALTGCGEPGAELVEDNTVAYFNMLTGEACEPNEATFQSRGDEADHGGEQAQGGEDNQFRGGDTTGAGGEQCQGDCASADPAGEQCGGEQCGGECSGEHQGEPSGEQQGETGECQGTMEQTQQRTQEGLMCGEGYFHAEDFPQPGCDAEGCCQIRAEDVDPIQNRERIRCRCRARFQGDMDESSLPECCADRPERQCKPEDEPVEGDPTPQEPV